MQERKCFRRAKVNCLCRCTPHEGIVSLNAHDVYRIKSKALSVIYTSRSTGVIADVAVRTGRILENTGHLPLALHVYRAALRTIFGIDVARAEDYLENGPRTSNPHYRYWAERIADAHALDVARCLDALYRRMGFKAQAHQCRKVRYDYEHLFNVTYSAYL